jgi:quercetin dioxygenase-like cupin family protein
MLYNIETLPSFEITKGFVAKMIHTDRVTIAYVDVEAGAELPEHSHPHEQVTTILEGQFEFVLDGQTMLLEPGVAVVIPSNVKHAGRAITACRILDVFQPLREDFRSGTVAYARK